MTCWLLWIAGIFSVSPLNWSDTFDLAPPPALVHHNLIRLVISGPTLDSFKYYLAHTTQHLFICGDPPPLHQTSALWCPLGLRQLFNIIHHMKTSRRHYCPLFWHWYLFLWRWHLAHPVRDTIVLMHKNWLRRSTQLNYCNSASSGFLGVNIHQLQWIKILLLIQPITGKCHITHVLKLLQIAAHQTKGTFQILQLTHKPHSTTSDAYSFLKPQPCP